MKIGRRGAVERATAEIVREGLLWLRDNQHVWDSPDVRKRHEPCRCNTATDCTLDTALTWFGMEYPRHSVGTDAEGLPSDPAAWLASLG